MFIHQPVHICFQVFLIYKSFKMFKKSFLLVRTALLTVAAAALFGCDDKEPEPVYQLDVLAAPGSPAIFTPAQVIGSFQSAEISLNGQRGTAQLTDSSRYIMYTPASEFTSGTDELLLEVVDSKGVAKRVTVTIAMQDAADCLTGGIPDHVEVKQGEEISVELLANDLFCPAKESSSSVTGRIAVLSAPSSGSYGSVNLNMFGDGRVTLTYEAPTDVTGTVQVVYEVGLGSSGGSADDEGNLLPQAFANYVVALVTIEISE